MNETALQTAEGIYPANEKHRLIVVVRAINRISYERLLPAALWLLFARSSVIHTNEAILKGDWLLSLRSIANLTFTLLVITLFLVRRPVKGRRARLLEAFVAVIATFAPILLAMQPVRFPTLLLAGNVIGLLGLLWALASLAALGRCFGLFPEVRGLVTRGPYRFVRHPLYLGEIVMDIGILLPVFSPLSLVVCLGIIGLLIWRSFNEEHALKLVFSEYILYQAETSRLIPFFW